jgi:hypothetical protein
MTATVKQGRLSAPPPPPAIGSGLLLPDDPFAGHLFMQDRVRCGAATGLFDDVVGRGWTLLSSSCDPATQLDAELAGFFRSIGGITTHVGSDAPVADVSGSYTKWFNDNDVAVALQRPDFYLFGTAHTADGATQLIGALRRMLRGH